MDISELYIVPIKSCSAQRVKQWRMDATSGRLAFDREFALVDTSGSAIRLQSCPKMAKLSPTIDLGRKTMTVSAPGFDDLVLRLDEEDEAEFRITSESEESNMNDVVKVCGNTCGGRLWGDYTTSEWFSSFLGVQCWLARSSGSSRSTYNLTPLSGASNIASPAPTDLSNGVRNPGVAFANEQPLLLITQHAVDTLNSILSHQNQKLVSSRQFRPNLVVNSENQPIGSFPLHHIEDDWSTVTIMKKQPIHPTIELQVRGNCARCAMVDMDPATLEKGQVLRALSTYRRQNGQINFGIFLESTLDTTRMGEIGKNEVWVEEGDSIMCT